MKDKNSQWKANTGSVQKKHYTTRRKCFIITIKNYFHLENLFFIRIELSKYKRLFQEQFRKPISQKYTFVRVFIFISFCFFFAKYR